MLLRRYVQAGWYNSIFTDFNGAAVQWRWAPDGCDAEPDRTTCGGASPRRCSPTTFSRLRRTTNLDPRLMMGSPAIGASRPAPSDGFYSSAAFKGAFLDRNWATDWTALSAYGILSAEGGFNPMDQPVVTPSEPPTLTAVREGTGLRLTWVGGRPPFTVQRKAAVSDAIWMDLGVVNETSFLVPIDASAAFLRVVSP
jgi:hypothetical protein